MHWPLLELKGLHEKKNSSHWTSFARCFILSASLLASTSAYGENSNDIHFGYEQRMLPPHSFSFSNPMQTTISSLSTMQSEFFHLWLGTWPTSIDWTGAVIGTYVSATLETLSSRILGNHAWENEVNLYFGQMTAYYFGENAFTIRGEAYDDMLWVVLGWLEGVKFIEMHDSRLKQRNVSLNQSLFPVNITGRNPSDWHGTQFIPAFAHRAHVFYEIAERGWDDKLCGGGLTWNPRLAPYKNTITNTLFIAASVGMYLWHPGDRNRAPFMSSTLDPEDGGLPRARPHDPRYLATAEDAYEWLLSVNLTNSQGLFVDGFHISNWKRNGTSCDERNEMVYTYNQAVLLSALRGLWEATGRVRYLEDAHRLMRNVIAATGWHDTHAKSQRADGDDKGKTEKKIEETADKRSSRPQWHGLGQSGILSESCDPSCTCSQDAQTFKGIFFHHFTLFCKPLPTQKLRLPGKTHLASPEEAIMHARSCKSYVPWVTHNAKAALRTRSHRGIFGMWWGAGSRWEDDKAIEGQGEGIWKEEVMLPVDAVDLRNSPGMLNMERWRRDVTADVLEQSCPQRDKSYRKIYHEMGEENYQQGYSKNDGVQAEESDYNDRGRGRTVETQGGGLMVVRALWELLDWYEA